MDGSKSSWSHGAEPVSYTHLDVYKRQVHVLRADLARSGVNCLLGHAVLGTVGPRALAAVHVAPLTSPNSVRTLACDALFVSGGWSPSIHAGLQEGGAAAFLPQIDSFGAAAQPSWRRICGAANGKLELAEILRDGHAAGVAAAQAASLRADPGAPPVGRGDAAPNLESFWRSPAPLAQELSLIHI